MPPIPEVYIYLFGIQCLVSLCNGLAGYAIPLYNTLTVQKSSANSPPEPVHAPGSLDPSTLPTSKPVPSGLQTVCTMLNAGWPVLLATLSFLMTTNLSDVLFSEVLGTLQVLACTAGCLALPTLHDVFLTALAKAALPLHIIPALDKLPTLQGSTGPCSPVSLEGLTLGLAGGGSGGRAGTGGAGSARSVGLSLHNLACLHTLVSAALFLVGMLGPSWFAALRALQNADYVLTTCVTLRWALWLDLSNLESSWRG
jgi:hypothetical protein